MLFDLCRISFLFSALWLAGCSADDMVMQVFANRPINHVSDKFISFSMSPADLVEIYQNKRNSFTSRMRALGPSLLKIAGSTDAKNHFAEMDASKLNLGEWLYDTAKSHDLKLVVPLPYDPKKWNPRTVIKMLGKFSNIDMDNVMWQLGSDFHATDAMKYIDDLSTMRTIVDAFATMNKNLSWTVIGSDLTVGSNENEARLYSELSEHTVSAVGWTQSSESLYPEDSIENVFAAQNIDPALRTILNSRMPVWLTLSHLNHETGPSDSKCHASCEAKGLKWAQTLGDASRNGFNMVYAPIDQYEWFRPSLTYYTTLLHKQLMGKTVLATKIVNGNRFDTHVYSHCAKNASGAFTIYGVNMADTEANVVAKMPPMRAGTEYQEYVLTVNRANGRVLLNGNDIFERMPLIPAIKVKRVNKPAALWMPAHSVAFWVFTEAKLQQCERVQDSDQTDLTRMGRTSSEKLLQDLIRDQIVRDAETEKNMIEKTKSVRRERRAIHNNIEKGHTLNAIKKNVDGDENGIHRRNRRSIDDDASAARLRRAGNLRNLIYNEMDLMKRRQIHSPFVAKEDTEIESNRSKRHINALSKLLEKFELKKPTFNFKPPSFKLSAAAIPPITAVHDIYSVNSAERKVFSSVENPDLPAGDVHFDVEELANGAPNPAIAGYNGPPNPVRDAIMPEMPLLNEPMREVVPDVMNPQGQSEVYYESLFGDAPLAHTPPPPQPFNQPASSMVNPQQQARYDELWEIDAAQFPPMPSLAPKLPPQNQEASLNTNIDFVVKELQPTWQKNQENLEKARNNMQKFYPPSLGGSKISSLLPNVARPQNLRSPFFDSAEKRFFETRRRRRRSIATDMNDEIEQRLQEMTDKHPQSEESGEYNDLDDAISKLSILDRALKIVGDFDHTQNPPQKLDFSKVSADLKRLGEIVAQSVGNASPATTPSPMTDDNLQKRCKILSKSLEQRCMHESTKPLAVLFKRDQEDKAKKPTGPFKKLLNKVKENQRAKRSVGDAYDEITSNAIHLNEIPNELFGEAKEIGNDFVKRPYVHRSTTTTEKPIHEHLYDTAQEHMPKLLGAVKSTVNQIMDTVTKQVAGWWQAWL